MTAEAAIAVAVPHAYPRSAAWADRLAITATLLCPLLLLHARAGADIAISLTGLTFLAGSWARRDWAWLRTPWVMLAGAWWAWLVICSVPPIGQTLGGGGVRSLTQAVVAVRFLIFAAALQHGVLRAAWRRRVLAGLVSLSALYIALQALLQFATGYNLYGYPRWPDGTLTGPFNEPRAGAIYSRLMFPALLPVAERLLRGAGRWRAVAAGLLTLAAVVVGVLFGQRMPVLLIGLGLVVSALLLPRLRVLALSAGAAVLVVVAATVVISPPTYHRLVIKFSHQMEHFRGSSYGQIAARSVTMVEANPWTGGGFDAFRRDCAKPRYFRGWPALLGTGVSDGGGAAICVQHPHNHYLQAAVESGLPGLALFCGMVLAWLLALGRGLWRDPDPLRVGLFVAVLLQEWPIASASDFVNMPLGGWFFLLLGLGLAYAEGQGLRPIEPLRGSIPAKAQPLQSVP